MKRASPLTRLNRRTFIRNLGYSALTVPPFLMSAMAPVDEQGSLLRSGKKSALQPDKEKLGVALVGLGKYSTEQLAPALEKTNRCYLAGIVTGSPHKVEQWQRRYTIPDKNIYSYQNFDAIKDNPDIDIVYVVLPNAMHAPFTMRAARAGKHVICEKPMGISVSECEDMIRVCRESNRLLSVGYRLHFEPHNLTMMEFGKKQPHGKIVKLTAQNGMTIASGVWRLDKELAGGGPLMDVGIYCIQAAIYTVGQPPIAVTAQEGKKTDPEKFSEVEQSLTWQMEFPGGVVAQCETSYAEELNLLRVEAERGWAELKPAYAYSGIRGRTSEGRMKLPQVNQQALQMDDFAACVTQNKDSRVPGEMGLRDVSIMMAIYEAAATGERITLDL